VGAGSPTSIGHPGAPTYAVMLVGNKSDKKEEREVSYSDGVTSAKILGCDFLETSAKITENVEEAFYDIVRSLRRTDPLNEE